jgi:hypothetical protein
MSAGRSPRRSPPDPRPPAPGAARGARSARAPRSADRPGPVVARRASPGVGQIDPVVRHPLQQVLWPRRRGPAVAAGFCSPWAAVPGDCLRLLADLQPDSIDHALQVGLQPPAPPGRHQHPGEQLPRRGSGISACQLLPILGVSRVAGCGNRYLPRSSPFTQRVPGPRPLQPEPRPAQRSGPAAQRRSPAPTAVSSRADIDDLLVVGHPGAVGTARGTVVRDRPWPPGTAHAARHGPRRVHRRHRRD